MRCPNCGSSMPDNWRFCGRCGETLHPLQSATPPRSSCLLRLAILLAILILALVSLFLLGQRTPLPGAIAEPLGPILSLPAPIFEPLIPGRTPRPTATDRPPPDPIAERLPPQTALYLGLDLQQANGQRLAALRQAFKRDQAGTPAPYVFDLAALTLFPAPSGILTSAITFYQITDALPRGLVDSDFLSGIRTWAGRYAGLGITQLKFDQAGNLQDYTLVVMIEVGDKALARQFASAYQGRLESVLGSPAQPNAYQNISIPTVIDPESQRPYSLAYTDAMVYLGIGAGAIEQALDARPGKTLYTESRFEQLTGRLPRERMLTLYTQGQAFKDLYPLLLAQLNSSQSILANLPITDLDMIPAWDRSACGLSLTAAGLNVDSAMLFDQTDLNPRQQQRLSQTSGALPVIEALPDSTYFFLAGKDVQQVWDFLRALGSSGNPVQFSQLGALFKAEVGFNPETDLLPYARGDWAMGLFTTQDGVFARSMQKETGLPAGLIFTLGIADQRRTQGTLDAFTAWGRRYGLIVNEGSTGSAETYHLTNKLENKTVLVYSLSQDRLDISTSLDPWNAASAPITQDPAYQAAWSQFAPEMAISYYIDFARFLELFQSDPETSQDTAALRALHVVASARQSAGPNTLLNRVVILIQP